MTHSFSHTLVRRLFATMFSRVGLSVAIILVIASFFRLYRLGEIPRGLNRDEASLGYTAYSLLTTGMDEHGVAHPINIQSFGDWKLPLYVYTTIPVIQIFGLSAWSVRLPSALAGIVIVILSMMLTRLLIETQHSSRLKFWLPILVGLLMAVNPWAIHVSRIAYEANLTYAYVLLGFVTLLMGFQRHLSKELFLQRRLVWMFSAAALCFGLSVFGYHAFQLFTPLMGVVILILWRQQLLQLWTTHKGVFVLSAAIIGVLFSALLFAKTGSANGVKFGGINAFEQSRYADALFTQRQIVGELHPLLAKLYVNRITISAATLVHHTLSLWNPTYLFLESGSHGSHSLVDVASFYPIESMFIAIGFWWFFRERKRWQGFILVWIVVASIAPIITIEPTHPIRFLPALFPLVVLSAYGVYRLAQLLATTFPLRVLQIVMIGVMGYSVFQFVVYYFVIFPIRDVDRWPWQMEPIVDEVQKIDATSPVFMQGESSSPYIYFLFHAPASFAIHDGDIEYFPATDEGFVHVSRLKNIRFGKIDWEAFRSSSINQYAVLETKEVPAFVFEDDRFSIIREWESEYATTHWYLIAFTPESAQ